MHIFLSGTIYLVYSLRGMERIVNNLLTIFKKKLLTAGKWHFMKLFPKAFSEKDWKEPEKSGCQEKEAVLNWIELKIVMPAERQRMKDE